MGLLNLGLLLSVTLRRYVKERFFLRQDERRLGWAHLVEETLAHGQVADRAAPLSSDWERAAAEDVLLQRWVGAAPPARLLLRALFYRWNLLQWRRARLRGKGKWEQARSALVLARFQCREALPDILWLLKRASASTQVAALNALELMGDPNAIDALVEFLAQRGMRQSRPLQSALIECSRSAPERLLPHLSHPLPWVRGEVAGALAEVAAGSEVPALLPVAFDMEPEVRARIARALGHTRDPRVLEALRRLAGDPVWFVRLQAVGALAQIQQAEGEEAVWKAMRDDDWRVREKAALALLHIVRDPVYLLRRLREEINDRYALEILACTLEREGVTWKAINGLCSADGAEQGASQALVRELLRSECFTSTLVAIEMHPEEGVRQEALRLLSECAPAALPDLLGPLLASPRLDQQIQQQIQALLAGYGK